MSDDQHIRQQAIDPEQSFIVQAPAGSGKTELLTQRYLRLLANVTAPEEIIAITFTRKAAGEMRARILAAFDDAAHQTQPNEPHKTMTWQLAQQALMQNKKQGWHIDNNPNRLRIMTIDALASYLCHQMPTITGLDAQPNIVEDARPYFRQAITNTLADPRQQPRLGTLLLHLDNNAELLIHLLSQLLNRREQWLPHIIHHYRDPDALKTSLEKALEHIATDAMARLQSLIDDQLACEIIPLAHFAATQITAAKHPTKNCLNLATLPGCSTTDIAVWQGIAEMLLKKDGQWRKTVDIRNGFPATTSTKDKELQQLYKDYKIQIMVLLAELNNHESLRLALGHIRHCPPIKYTDKQWDIIHALVHLLPVLSAQLNLVFQQHGVIDFTESNLSALRALGDRDSPSDYALQLDYKIQHLLIDEFQDTSMMQFRLIEQLMAGWQHHDGRSIFVVGDPMQSIYRFRQAEVSLFLWVQQHGIADLPLTQLTLCHNFRSQQRLVEWFNSTFAETFPQQADMDNGAIPYTSATSTLSNDTNSGVQFYPLLNKDESQQIVTIINNCRTGKIAILVRSRYQLLEITPTLREANIPFHAIDIETLAHRPEIQDLLSLTQALFHLGDRLAWLAVLRAPWCGLKLADLHALTQFCHVKPLWWALQQHQDITALSADGQQQLKRVVPILMHARRSYGQMPLATWLEGIWLTLGGPATLTNLDELANAEAYFRLVERIEAEFNIERLENKLHQLYAQIDHHDDNAVQIMTIHKAKGLEFDHIILPSCHRKTPTDSSRLLLWMERPSRSDSENLILAPIKSKADDHDPMYHYLKTVEKNKLDNEAIRLFYVAATRAKQSLHILTTVSLDGKNPDQLKAPVKGSFMAMLWLSCHEEINQAVVTGEFDDDEYATITAPTLRRLVCNWQPPFTIDPPSSSHKTVNTLMPNALQQRHIGTVMHEALQDIANGGDTNNPAHWQRRLRQRGVSPTQLGDCLIQLVTAIKNCLSDSRGQWILSSQHQHTQSEYPLSHRGQRLVIDRTFIDKDGTRWIIDYKSATPKDNDIDQFLQQQRAEYQQQLQLYGDAFHQLEQRPIKLALYFPLCLAWCEWDYQEKNSRAESPPGKGKSHSEALF